LAFKYHVRFEDRILLSINGPISPELGEVPVWNHMITIGKRNEAIENATNATIVTTLFFAAILFAFLRERKISFSKVFYSDRDRVDRDLTVPLLLDRFINLLCISGFGSDLAPF